MRLFAGVPFSVQRNPSFGGVLEGWKLGFRRDGSWQWHWVKIKARGGCTECEGYPKIAGIVDACFPNYGNHTVDASEILHHQFWMVETCWNPIQNGMLTTVFNWGFRNGIHSRFWPSHRWKILRRLGKAWEGSCGTARLTKKLAKLRGDATTKHSE